MMTAELSCGDRERRLDEAIARYLKLQAAGQTPDRESWLAEFPDLAVELGEFLDDAAHVHGAFQAVPKWIRELDTSADVVPTQSGQVGEATVSGERADSIHSVPDATPPRIAIGSRLDTYELLEKLGEGGMGTVWKARHVKLDKFVALKLLPLHLTSVPETVRRFEREMRAVGKVEHPHVVRAMDAREVGGLHFLVLEYVEGTDLSKYILARGPRSPADACRMVRHAALGLAAAHAQGLIHRDIKPSNLLLSKQGQVKVLDLGLARLLADGPEARQLTLSGQVLGTPDYMAPEQWDDTHTVDHRADLYALGCTLCFLLTGRAPFGDDRHSTIGTKMKGHLFETIPRLRDLRADVPEELDDLYERLMEKDPARRLGSAEETATLLKTMVQTQTTNASPVPAAEPVAWNASPVPAALLDSAATKSTTGTQGTVIAANREALQLEIRPRAKTQSATTPPRRRNPLVIAAAGGAALVLALVAVVMIKIVNPDGSTTVIHPPDGASVIVLKDGQIVSKVDQPKGSTKEGATELPSTSTSANSPPLPVAPFDAMKAREHQEAWAKHLGVPVEFTNSIGMKFRLIPPGEFTMGMTHEEAEAIASLNRKNDGWKKMALSSAPAHRVRLSRAYYMGAYEVTQEQYGKLIGSNPAYFSAKGQGKAKVAGEDTRLHPVDTVSYIGAADFCIKLSEQEMLKPAYADTNGVITLLPGDGYRLPTEAEWEWACRAGTTTFWSNGEQEGALGQFAWWGRNSGGMTHPVGQLQSNPFGLYDIVGNVWEWCQDWYDAQAYSRRGVGPTVDPIGPDGPDAGWARVFRGGRWSMELAGEGRIALRNAGPNVETKSYNTGFRVVASVNVPRSSR